MKSLIYRTEFTGQVAAAQGWLATHVAKPVDHPITGLPFGNQRLHWSVGKSGGYGVDVPVPIRI